MLEQIFDGPWWVLLFGLLPIAPPLTVIAWVEIGRIKRRKRVAS